MTIIPGAFYGIPKKTSIIAPITGPKGEFIGKQEKGRPFDCERGIANPGNEAKIFNACCKFGVIICYDMVFPKVANTLAKKGAQALLSPSRIAKRVIEPWQAHVQVRTLENRIPVFAANAGDRGFGGSRVIAGLAENNKVATAKIIRLNGEKGVSKEFSLDKYHDIRKKDLQILINFSDYLPATNSSHAAFALTSEVCSMGCFIR